MFMGEYNHSLDAKGRTIVPAKLREELGETFVITRGLDGCLYGYSDKEWEKFEEKLKNLPLNNKAARTTIRYFLAGATQCEVDKQGRILIPANLREAGGFEKDIVFIGAANKIEIWSKQRWDECNKDYQDNMDEVIEHMEDLGFDL